MCASRCSFQHLWMTNAWASCTSLYFQWAGMKHKVSETLISFSRSANRWYEVQMHKFYVWFKHLFVCVCVCSLCSLHVCTAAKSNALWAERNRMGGFVKAGAHMLVNLQAGNCTGIDTQTHTLPTIYTQFVTQAPTAAEAILPSCTSLDLALLRTLSSVL